MFLYIFKKKIGQVYIGISILVIPDHIGKHTWTLYDRPVPEGRVSENLFCIVEIMPWRALHLHSIRRSKLKFVVPEYVINKGLMPYFSILNASCKIMYLNLKYRVSHNTCLFFRPVDWRTNKNGDTLYFFFHFFFCTNIYFKIIHTLCIILESAVF